MQLADWSAGSLARPSALTYLHTSPGLLVFTQRTHRGLSTLAYTWSPRAAALQLWKTATQSEQVK